MPQGPEGCKARFLALNQSFSGVRATVDRLGRRRQTDVSFSRKGQANVYARYAQAEIADEDRGGQGAVRCGTPGEPEAP